MALVCGERPLDVGRPFYLLGPATARGFFFAIVGGMPTTRYRGPPMTLANMRAQGVRSLFA